MNPEPWPMPADRTERWNEERLRKWSRFALKVSEKYPEHNFYKIYMTILNYHGVSEDYPGDNDFFRILDSNTIDELYIIYENEMMQECL